MDVVNIAFVFDDKFSDIFMVALFSIADNTKSDLDVYVVDCGISEKNKNKILNIKHILANVRSIKIKRPIRIPAIENFPMPTHFNSCIFYRLAIAKVFPDLNRVIYLDCDIIAAGDIAELWSEDLQDKAFGVVAEDGNFFDPITRISRKRRLGIAAESVYYSSGMILMNTKKFEQLQIFEQVINCVANLNIVLECPEQDAMNICLSNDKHILLSPKYNFCPFSPLAEKCLKKIHFPVIIHYSVAKPWGFNKKIILTLKKLGFFKYSTLMILKFWANADRIDRELYCTKNCKVTIKFFYKRLFQPIEFFVAKRIRDSFGRFISKVFHRQKKM